MVISLTFKMRQTMKKYFIFFVSVALALAASCNKMEEADNNSSVAETELITVELAASTKTSLSGSTTIWSDGDAVSITVGGESIGTLTLVEGNIFSGEILAGYDGEATLNYPANVTTVPATQAAVENSFAEGAALLEGITTLADLRAGNGATLSNKTALLQFSVEIAGDVAFTIGSETYTVTGCEAGKTYYACVDPAVSGQMSYSVGIVKGAKTKSSFAPVANTVYPIGALELKKSTYGIVGDNNNWTDAYMYETTVSDNFFVLYNVGFTAAGGFKVRKDGQWNDDYNFGTTTTAKQAANEIVGVYTDGGSKDIEVNAGTYDIYFDRIAGQIYIMNPGASYTTATKQTHSSSYVLAGSFTGSNWTDNVVMNYSGDGVWTYVQDFKANDEFKVKIKGSWNSNWGYDNVYPGNGLVSNSGGNAKVKAAGTYIVGFYLSGNKITLVKK